MCRYLFIIFFAASLSYIVSAQDVDSLDYSHRFARSIGVAFPSLNYPLLSELNYSGYALGFHSVRFREKKNFLNQIQLHSEIGVLYNRANDSYIASLDFRGDWSRHWYVTERAQAFRLLCGLGVNAGIGVYMKEGNNNNPLAYFFNLSVSPSVLAKYRFHIGNTEIDLGQQIDVPAASLVSYSGYSSSLPYALVEDEANFFDAMTLTSFKSYKKYAGISTIDIIPSREGRRKCPSLRITYICSGMNYKRNDISIKSVDHSIMIGAIFRMFR